MPGRSRIERGLEGPGNGPSQAASAAWILPPAPASLLIEGERVLERRLAAILAADVVGYTRLMGEDEAVLDHYLEGLRKAGIAE